MKKQKTLAVLLSAAMVAGAMPAAAFADVTDDAAVGAEAAEDEEVEVQAAEESENEELSGKGFVLMNVPYDKLYKADLNDNDVPVDAVSSATKQKTKNKSMVNGSYHSEDGSEIKGSIIPVYVDDLSMLKGYKRLTDSNTTASSAKKVASASDALFASEEDYSFYVLPKDYKPKVYKHLEEIGEDGKPVFGSFEADDEYNYEKDVEAAIIACSGQYQPGKPKDMAYHGDYEITIPDFQKSVASSSDAVYEIVLETDEGDYGLRLLENSFLVKGELGFSTGFTTKSKGCTLNPNHYRSIVGKTITRIRFVTENGIFEIPTELKVEEQEVYALMNIPYDELYKNDLKNNSIPVDAMTSATYQKSRTKSLANGSYHENAKGDEVKGVTFPVKLNLESDAVLENLTRVGDHSEDLTITTTLRGQEQTNIYTGKDTLFENDTYAYYILRPEDKPDFYKEVTVGADGKFEFSETKFQDGKSVQKSNATAAITTKTTRGDYQIDVTGLDASVTNSSIYEVILETKDGKSYGLRHLENIWRGNELGIYTGYTKESHGVDASVEPYKDIMGKTINKITYLTSAGAYEIDTDLYVPVKDGTTAAVTSGKAGNGSVTVDVKFPEGFDPEYTVDGLDTEMNNGVLTYKNAMPGRYTLTISDKSGKWADIETEFVISTDKTPVYYSNDYSAPAILRRGSASEAEFANYIKNIEKVTVNGKEYAATGKGAVVIVKEDGTIDLTNSAVFDGSEPYTIVVSAAGYPDFQFTIKKSSTNSSSSDSDSDSNGSSGSSSAKSSADSISGTWSQDATGKWYFKNTKTGKNLASTWAYISNPYAGAGQPGTSWFHFDADGVMQTGWFKDIDGRWYYLNPASDNTQGRMMTGWNWIKSSDGKFRCYYFEESSNGYRGAMYSGKKTPDGYTVDADGAWTVDDAVVTK